jgi:hypothetical protein
MEQIRIQQQEKSLVKIKKEKVYGRCRFGSKAPDKFGS